MAKWQLDAYYGEYMKNSTKSLNELGKESLASFLSERKITKVELNGVEAKELVLNYLGARGTPFHQQFKDELKSISNPNSEWNEVLT